MGTTVQPEVHWEEGMFLRAQHFQALSRQVAERAATVLDACGVGCWGIKKLRIDRERLANHQFSVTELEGILQDGTPVSVPGNAVLSQRAFREAFEASRGCLEVFVALPVPAPGLPVIAASNGDRARFSVSSEELPDENTGKSAETVLVRRLNLRLLFGDEDAQGYQTIKIAEIVYDNDVDLRPMLSGAFVPPLLDLAADLRLRAKLLAITDAVRASSQKLGQDLGQRPVSFAIEAGADPESILKLQATNEVNSLLAPVCATPGVHPFEAYRALSEAVGKLAIFGREQRACPELPRYDHEALGPIFDALIGQVRTLLASAFPASFERRLLERLEAQADVVGCRLEKEWFARGCELYLALEGDLGNHDEVDEVVQRRLKLTGKDDVTMLRSSVVPGIALRRVTHVPAALPALRDVVYYRLAREETRVERLQSLERSQEIALFSSAGQVPDLRFFLYVTKPNGKGT